jgi:predicted dehydrogenase
MRLQVGILFALAILCRAQEPLKLGIVGLDTSHVIQFTGLLNEANRKEHVSGAVVVAAYKGGSPTVAESRDRIERFTTEVTTKHNVKLVDSIPELCKMVDAVLLLSVDGRQHLEQVKPVFAAKKPVFIDKPLAGNFRDGREIVRLAKQSGVPFFSASSERFVPVLTALKNDSSIGRIEGAMTFGPMAIETYMPDLFWYGIHSVEMLYQLMGPGCERVARIHTDGADSVVGTWRDGRIGEMRGLRSSPRTYGAIVYGSKKVQVSRNLANSAEKEPTGSNYRVLMEEIVQFFRTGKPPVTPEESLEVLAFMEAADLSKQRNGAPVSLKEVMESK